MGKMYIDKILLEKVVGHKLKVVGIFSNFDLVCKLFAKNKSRNKRPLYLLIFSSPFWT